MEFAFQFDEARNRQNTKIKQNIQYIDDVMATKEQRQREQFRNLNRMTRECHRKVICE